MQKGYWEKSHELISEDHSQNTAAIHAYLHRKEGDLWNAEYWHKELVLQNLFARLKMSGKSWLFNF